MSRGGETLVFKARAKVNLFLEVLGRRENGYHDIRSVLVPVSLHDVVRLEGTDGEIETVMSGAVCSNGSQHCVPASADNLATRAATAMKRMTGAEGGVRITIEKHIPIGGGLGGGSADAAAVLVGLNRLWNKRLSASNLMEIGASLGCDIPAMVYGGTVRMEGLGETIKPIALKPQGRTASWGVVIVNPGFSVLTRDIYERCTVSLTARDELYRKMISAMEEGDLEMASRSLFNGLQETVCRKFPLIGIVAEEVQKAGALGVLVSGSGASVFGLARDEAEAGQIAARLSSCDLPIWSVVARIVPDGVMVAHGPLEA